MKNSDVIRAWTDRDFRNELSSTDRKALPEHPTGIAEIEDDALTSITGGWGSTPDFSCVPPGHQCP